METLKFSNDTLYLLDQRKLPNDLEYFPCRTYQDVCFAIKDMVVRGAPAIGVAAAYGVYLAFLEYQKEEDFLEKMKRALQELSETRPTAVNLFWAIERMEKILKKSNYQDLLEEAKLIHKEDLELNHKMASYGEQLLGENFRILTHCNAGALATAGYGTALGVIRKAHENNKVQLVYVDETRPLLQGARLTAYELLADGIPIKLIADNMAGYCMSLKKIDCVIVGADRIASNGDVANKIGTYSLAVLAKYHNIPFYVAAPYSTFDLSLKNGQEIPIEERDAEELRKIKDSYIAPKDADVFNPAFDITPHELITAIITDRGVIEPDFKENILEVLKDA